jgi:hypothetical protein
MAENKSPAPANAPGHNDNAPDITETRPDPNKIEPRPTPGENDDSKGTLERTA